MPAIRSILATQIPPGAIKPINIIVAIGHFIDEIIPRLGDPAQLAAGTDQQHCQK